MGHIHIDATGAALIILPIFMGFLSLMAAKILTEVHSALKIFLVLMGLFAFNVSLWFAHSVVYYMEPSWTEMSNILATSTLVFGLVWGAVVMYFLLYAFIVFVKGAAQEDEDLEY